jgi:putative chitinase
MRLTSAQVQALTGDAERWLEPLNAALARWEINTPDRAAMFLAQCGHESGGFRRLTENLNYTAAQLLRTWPNRFTADDAAAMALQPEKIAERAYGGRMGNAAEGGGDGWRFRGRGIIQLTGRENYRLAGQALGIDATGNPEQLAEPAVAAQVAGWYWATNGCNALADAGDYAGITRRINGGMNGWDDRVRWLARVREALGVQTVAPVEDRSTQYQAPAGPATEEAMGVPLGVPLMALGAIPEIVKMIPQLVGVFGGNGEKAAQKLAAAETVIQAFTGAVPGAVNVQDAVERAQADATVRAAAKAAVEASPAVMGLIEVGGGVTGARKANADYLAGLEDDEWWRMLLKLVCNPTLLISAAGFYLVWMFVNRLVEFLDKVSPDVISGTMQSVISLILGAVMGFWLGQTYQQQKRSE